MNDLHDILYEACASQMKPTKPIHQVSGPNSPTTPGRPGFEAKILRLVKGAPARRAIASGQVDAIIDPASGRAILLPDAQAALLEHKAKFRSLVELSSDGTWEQDEHYRFVSHTGAPIGGGLGDDAGILGKT